MKDDEINNSKFYERLLEAKRKKFIEVVNRVCNVRNLPIPSINFDYCPDEDGNQLAHIHLDIGVICVSKRQLTMLNLDDIEETATHEVTHILESGHNSNFQHRYVESKLGAWRLPGGIPIVDGGKKSEPEKGGSTKKPKAPRTDKTRCNYHLCRKIRKLAQCEYCGKYFCKEHISAKRPSMPPFIEGDMDEWRKPGHPCLYYAYTADETLRLEQERYRKALDKLLSHRTGSIMTYKENRCQFKACGSRYKIKIKCHYCGKCFCKAHKPPDKHECNDWVKTLSEEDLVKFKEYINWNYKGAKKEGRTGTQKSISL